MQPMITTLPSLSERETEQEGRVQPTANAASMAPVGPSIAVLLDEAQEFQTTTVTEPAVALVNRPIEASADQEFQATTATEPTAEFAPPIVTLTNHAYQVTTASLETPPLVEIGETTSVPSEAITATAAALTSPPAHAVTIAQEPDRTAWRPLLQVDRVIWPSIHPRLDTAAAAAIQQMSDGLSSICASGSKVLGLASCASGEGVTTLLLAAARNLLSQGRKVVVVDANWSNPQLAQCLGLLPQIGWEETLCGGLPLEEVVIESLADGLSVLPVREPSASSIAKSQIAASIDILAREFDVVLVDLGPLADAGNEDSSSRDVTARMDAVILVQNVRVTTPNRLAEVRNRLAASNLRHAGTIQNFVAG